MRTSTWTRARNERSVGLRSVMRCSTPATSYAGPAGAAPSVASPSTAAATAIERLNPNLASTRAEMNASAYTHPHSRGKLLAKDLVVAPVVMPQGTAAMLVALGLRVGQAEVHSPFGLPVEPVAGEQVDLRSGKRPHRRLAVAVRPSGRGRAGRRRGGRSEE